LEIIAIKVYETGTRIELDSFRCSIPVNPDVKALGAITKLDDAVIGMAKGEEKTIHIDAADAYGEPREELKKIFPRTYLPKDQEPKKGMLLGLTLPDGRQIPGHITAVTEENVTIDINHPLAGKALNFKIKIVEIS